MTQNDFAKWQQNPPGLLQLIQNKSEFGCTATDCNEIWKE